MPKLSKPPESAKPPPQGQWWYVDEDVHSWGVAGPFDSFDEALAGLKRIAEMPWGDGPNFPECGRLTCYCRFDLIECSSGSGRTEELRRIPVLERRSFGTRWLLPETQ